jgi:hypothetical protein
MRSKAWCSITTYSLTYRCRSTGITSMSTITAKIEKVGKVEMLTISLPISKSTSASGKSLVIASTRGNFQTTVMVDGKPLILGVNAYTKI